MPRSRWRMRRKSEGTRAMGVRWKEEEHVQVRRRGEDEEDRGKDDSPLPSSCLLCLE